MPVCESGVVSDTRASQVDGSRRETSNRPVNLATRRVGAADVR
jgi:hypothetical protein